MEENGSGSVPDYSKRKTLTTPTLRYVGGYYYCSTTAPEDGFLYTGAAYSFINGVMFTYGGILPVKKGDIIGRTYGTIDNGGHPSCYEDAAYQSGRIVYVTTTFIPSK